MKNRKKSNKKVFKGEQAITDFLTPGSVGLTPLVELPPSVNNDRKSVV